MKEMFQEVGQGTQKDPHIFFTHPQNTNPSLKSTGTKAGSEISPNIQAATSNKTPYKTL